MPFSNGLLTIRKSARAFARTPGLSLVLLLTIALGVGSNVSVFGFVQGLIHPNSPAKDEDRIVSIFAQDQTHPAGPLTRYQFQLLRSHSDAFVWIDGARIAPANVNLGGGSQIAIVAAVMPNLANELSLPQNGGVIISRRMWQREFGDSVKVVGQRILVNKIELPITGIAPDRLEGLYRDQIVDLWTPYKDGELSRSRSKIAGCMGSGPHPRWHLDGRGTTKYSAPARKFRRHLHGSFQRGLTDHGQGTLTNWHDA